MQTLLGTLVGCEVEICDERTGNFVSWVQGDWIN